MCHVLVIEDEFLISEHIAYLVSNAGATSIDQVDSQDCAVIAARLRRPEMIMSDVNILCGTGPLAVQAILQEHGAIPVIFITGTPDACEPRDPSSVILCKPTNDHQVRETFRRLAPAGA